MTTLRRLAYAALAFAYVHIVFGAIVRITGSGMGCGDHWPKCYGAWFPPLDRMDLVIEVSHRYLAFGLSVTILALLATAFLRRREPGVAGRGGVLRSAALALGLVLLAAVLGGVVVKLELTNPHVIVAHLGIAMALIGTLASAVVRAGGLGGSSLAAGDASAKTWRGARLSAALALVAGLLGGLTAHLPGANGACVGFPHCRETLAGGEALAVHVVHRVVAFLLLFHALGLAIGVRKRGEAPLVRRLAWIAFGVILAQVLVAAVLVELRLPAVWRSLHQAVGTGVWLATLLLAVLARRGYRGAPGIGVESAELRRPVAAATAAAMLAVDPGAAHAEPHAAEAWSEPPVAEAARGATEVDALAAAGIVVIDEAAVERSTVELTVLEEVEPAAAVDAAPAPADAIAPDWDALIAESSAGVEEWVPDVEAVEAAAVEDDAIVDYAIEVDAIEVDAIEDEAIEVAALDEDDEGQQAEPQQPDDEDEELDPNAAALAEIERIEVAQAAQSAQSAQSAAAEPAAPATRRPPTLAVIIARGADF